MAAWEMHRNDWEVFGNGKYLGLESSAADMHAIWLVHGWTAL
jgi:hypothetical protein